MRIFISSVRRGLEQERDALPGIVMALGHEPVRFEDFSSQNVPSREACLQAVGSSDVYVLLLGPNYGHRFPDTGQSPTHDEWVAARAAGKPCVVYRKVGVQFEPDQLELSREIGDYASGVFHDSFESVAELLTKVASKLRELEKADAGLGYEPVAASDVPEVEWRAERSLDDTGSASILELHILPIGTVAYTSRVMRQLTDSLIGRIRQSGLLAAEVALDLQPNADEALVRTPLTRSGGWNSSRDWQVVGVRLSKTGQLSAYATLPTNGLGSILDPDRLPDQIARILRLFGALRIVESERIAVAAGVRPVSLLSVGRFDPHGSGSGTTASFPLASSDKPLRVTPDEMVLLAALDVGAAEVAADLSRALVDGLRSLR